jgi:hypothetical protein
MKYKTKGDLNGNPKSWAGEAAAPQGTKGGNLVK